MKKQDLKIGLNVKLSNHPHAIIFSVAEIDGNFARLKHHEDPAIIIDAGRSHYSMLIPCQPDETEHESAMKAIHQYCRKKCQSEILVSWKSNICPTDGCPLYPFCPEDVKQEE